jgi:hypothetical protein
MKQGRNTEKPGVKQVRTFVQKMRKFQGEFLRVLTHFRFAQAYGRDFRRLEKYKNTGIPARMTSTP